MLIKCKICDGYGCEDCNWKGYIKHIPKVINVVNIKRENTTNPYAYLWYGGSTNGIKFRRIR